MAYIDKDKLEEIITYWKEQYCPIDCEDLAEDLVAVIHMVPEDDTVNVVRCKDCRFFRKFAKGGWTTLIDACKLFDRDTTANDFCSHGERIEDERYDP